MRLVLLGPPGAGKGTQAHRLSDRFGIPLIATGDIFRSNVERDTVLGREARRYMDSGELVPDEVVVAMVVGALEAAPDGFILDGFPRNLAQAEALETELERTDQSLSAALAFSIGDDTAVRRLVGRRTCTTCQRTYNLALHPPKVGGICDVCGGRLEQRQDDREDTVRRRLEIYHESTEPLIGFYAGRDLLRTVDAEGTEEEVADRAERAVGLVTGGQGPPGRA
ncbi:MAG: adenylate kinase [Actinobacteria bacterium]|nr:adenylate kinase [Actinomycetota bacterium]